MTYTHALHQLWLTIARLSLNTIRLITPSTKQQVAEGTQHCCHRRRFEQKNVLTIKFSSFAIAARQQQAPLDSLAPHPVHQPQSLPVAGADPLRPKEIRQVDPQQPPGSCVRCAH